MSDLWHAPLGWLDTYGNIIAAGFLCLLAICAVGLAGFLVLFMVGAL